MQRGASGLHSRIFGLGTAFALLLAGAACGQDPAKGPPEAAAPGRFTVRTSNEDWRDASRDRTVPVRIFLPEAHDAATRPAAAPLVVISPGLGGSRATYGYLARHLAGHGYVVVVCSHPGSDTKDFGGLLARRARESLETGTASRALGALFESVNDPENLRQRPKDVSFVIDRVLAHPVLGPIVDAHRIGVAGHSFGAHTAMSLGGMTVDLPEEKAHSFRDVRVKAVLPMSPEGPGAMGISDGAWDPFAIPVMFLTGTLDYGVGKRSAEWRRSGFEGSRSVERYLVTIKGAGHMTFAMPGLSDFLPHAKDLIDSLALRFFDAGLREDADARAWLQAFFEAQHTDCIAEHAKGAPRAESR